MADKPTYEELEKQVEALREGEKRFQALFQKIPVPVYIWRKIGEDFVLMDCNIAGNSQAHGRISDYMGKTAGEMYADTPEILGKFSRCFNERTHFKQDMLYRFRTTGESKHFAVWYAFVPPDFVLVHTENITERVLAEDALRESEKKYRQLFDMESDAIFLIENETGSILEVNAAASELYGYSRKELLQKKNTELSAEPDKTRKATLGLLPQVPVRFHRKKDGTVFPVEITASHFSWLGREVHIAAIRDITLRMKEEAEKQKLQSRLLQAQKLEAIGTLAGGIAHDFNNLLMGIQGNVSLMFLDIDTTHPHYERTKSIEKQVQSGARLTSHLLGYARKGKYEIKPVALNELVEETTEAFGRTKKEITVYQELAEDLFAIKADPGQIEQVLWNLFINAADAMPGGGNLTLKTANVSHKNMKEKLYDPKPGDYVLLTATDTGTGMDEETAERIFEPFFTTKEMGRGSGLGLASAYGIIKAHGGYVDVESKKGKGTTFSIYLPASDEKVRKVVKKTARIMKGAGTVLLVDDEETVLKVANDMLEAIGYRVVIAKNGKEAVEVYQEQRNDIDIVILDMVMPHMGGGEAYDRLKKIAPDIKVLLASGFSIDGEATEILKRGCNGFIQKPFNIKELSGKISEVLDKK